MKILIVGLGSIGRRHLKNILHLYPSADISVLHTQSKNTDNNEEISGVNHIFNNIEMAIRWEPNVAFLTCPAPLHIPVGQILANMGIHLFIEKPLSNTIDHIDEFQRVCKQNKIIVMVGYNLRFNPPLCAVKIALKNGLIGKPLSFRAEVGQYLPDWRPGSDYRRCVSSRKETGGGALLELSHEIDYARWLMGEISAVSAFVDHISDLEMDVEDIAEINIKFYNGVIGNIHLDMISRPSMRNCKIIGTEGMLFWDGIRNISKMYSSKTGEWSTLCESSDRDDMYLKEIQHFFSCIDAGKMPAVTFEEARSDLEIVLAAQRSSLKQRCVML